MQRNKTITRPNWLFPLFVALLAALLVYYFPKIRGEIGMLKEINFGWLISAIICQLFSYLVPAIIYRRLMLVYGVVPVPLVITLYKMSVVALFFNQTVPTAGISGNTFIFNFLVRRNVKAHTILSIILFELLIFYFAMLIYILFFLAWGLVFGMHASFITILSGGLVVYCLFTVGIIWLGRKRSLEGLFRRIGNIKWVRKYFERSGITITGIRDGNVNVVAGIARDKKTAFEIVCLQLLTVAIDALTIIAIFMGIGIHFSFENSAMVIVCARIVAILPIAPGGLVLYESSMVFLFNTLGISVGIAIMATLVFRLLSFWFPIPAGLLLYHRWIKKRW